ncbi:MAG TPA: hypothetical protein VF316_16445, partial [Polyangiaceae bacterium]
MANETPLDLLLDSMIAVVKLAHGDEGGWTRTNGSAFEARGMPVEGWLERTGTPEAGRALDALRAFVNIARGKDRADDVEGARIAFLDAIQ